MTPKQDDRSKAKPSATPDPGYDRDVQGDYPAYTGRIAEAETDDAAKQPPQKPATGSASVPPSAGNNDKAKQPA